MAGLDMLSLPTSRNSTNDTLKLPTAGDVYDGTSLTTMLAP